MPPEVPRIDTLADDQKAVFARLYEMASEGERDKLEIARLREQLAWMKRQIFGQKSERIVEPDPEQPELVGFECEAAEAAPVVATVVPAYTRRKRVRKGEGNTAIEYPENLPRQYVDNDLPEDRKFDPETGEPLVLLRVEKVEKLALSPASFYLKVISNYIYVKRTDLGSTVVQAPMPESPIPKSHADVSLIVAVLVMKYADHLPLNRISEIFFRSDVRISRQTLCNWVATCALILEPLFNRMFELILGGGVLFVDEIPIKVLAKGKCATSYIWGYVGGPPGDNGPPYRIFRFCDSREYRHLRKDLAEFRGLFHSDCYGAYAEAANSRPDELRWMPCGAHVRRKFFEADAGDRAVRDYFMRRLKQIFRFERVAWKRTPEQRLEIRNRLERPILDEMTARASAELLSGRHPPSLKLSRALQYFSKAAPHMKNYLDNPDARFDNNSAERALRPFAVGRNNWIFFGSEAGGKSAAIIASLIQTCRNLDINPQEYLEDVLVRMPSAPHSRLDDFLPDRWLAARNVTTPEIKMTGPYRKN